MTRNYPMVSGWSASTGLDYGGCSFGTTQNAQFRNAQLRHYERKHNKYDIGAGCSGDVPCPMVETLPFLFGALALFGLGLAAGRLMPPIGWRGGAKARFDPLEDLAARIRAQDFAPDPAVQGTAAGRYNA